MPGEEAVSTYRMKVIVDIRDDAASGTADLGGAVCCSGS